MSQSYFDLQGDQSFDGYQEVSITVDRLAADDYRDYKLKAYNQLKAHGPSHPYNALTSSQVLLSWYVLSFTLLLLRDSETQQWPDIIESFQTFCTLWNGNWVNQQTAGTSNQFSRDPQNDDPRFSMHEAKLHRMDRTIQRLKVNLKRSILVVVPDEDEDKENSGGLGDL
ncbi:hypothetical protein Adt_35347 [Abeliophyllum distichum]|uniref:Uncharacterized protein n=1 Tax=Abeliophyllum distichum TaxID=126358 RepID=A0ABD1QIG6_9LAMI